ncbi:MAG: hypothetical protein ACTHLV_02335, partial [Achromobacter mucicolens]
KEGLHKPAFRQNPCHQPLIFLCGVSLEWLALPPVKLIIGIPAVCHIGRLPPGYDTAAYGKMRNTES